ncbi:MAG: DUF1320 domain-containing protein [Nitrospirae bacterium]|nr:DUF1320 domain-containing protein [Nitrospirota bacterium]MCL5237412.1 DUF1320 domain-containing protein [Nitrospirota bacterium]
MPYCTLDDLKKAIPESSIIQLTDDAGLGVVDQAKVDDAIAYADQLIDGYLRGRYTLPLSTVPGLIKTLSVDLAIFHLYGRKSDDEFPDAVMARYKNAIKLLEQIQKGLISLGIETSTTGTGSYKTNKTSDDRTFNKDVLDTY